MGKHTSFQFKQFTIEQEHAALKLGTDAVLLGAITSFENPTNILDIGTGTGILALMMAQKYNCHITAIDIDEGAVTDATYNCNNSAWKDRISVQLCSLQEFAKEQNHTFDGIICNPPFFTNCLKNSNESKTNARHTTQLSSQDLFLNAKKILSPTGAISIIIPQSERLTFAAYAQEVGLYLTYECSIYPFSDSKEPNRCVLTYSQIWNNYKKEHIHIREDKTTYTHEYKELTTDFYKQI
ncbi:MAG: methyltransferase [Bacteroidales bacterium]|nr:methyltransferase [Bacteroidales bacterium]